MPKRMNPSRPKTNRPPANQDRVEPGDLGTMAAQPPKPIAPPRPDESRFENEGGATLQGQQIGGTPDLTQPQDPDSPPREPVVTAPTQPSAPTKKPAP